MKIVKKDGTKERFNVYKVVAAVSKSAQRVLVEFTQEDIDFICNFVETTAKSMGKSEITIPEMHNIVEGALERINPAVAKSYRDYRNYKQDFVEMLDEVYKKSQSIMHNAIIEKHHCQGNQRGTTEFFAATREESLVTVTEEDRVPQPEDFNICDYTDKIFMMYDGEEVAL